MLLFTGLVYGNFQAQDSTGSFQKDMYFSLKAELMLKLEEYPPSDSLDSILQTLLYLESEQLWDAGIILLQQVLSPDTSIRFKNSTNQTGQDPNSLRFISDLTIGAGVETYRNQFEILNLESDSLLSESTLSPGIYLRWTFGMNHGIPFSNQLKILNNDLFQQVDNALILYPNHPRLPAMGYRFIRNLDRRDEAFSYSEQEFSLKSRMHLSRQSILFSGTFNAKKYDSGKTSAKNFKRWHFFLSGNSPQAAGFGENQWLMEYFHHKEKNSGDAEQYLFGSYSTARQNSRWIFSVEPGFLWSKYKYHLGETEVLENSSMEIQLRGIAGRIIVPNVKIEWNTDNFIRFYLKQYDDENHFFWSKNKIGPVWQQGSSWFLAVWLIDELESHFTPNDAYNADDYHSLGTGASISAVRSRYSFFLEYEYLKRNTSAAFDGLWSYNQPSRNHSVYFHITWHVSSSLMLTGQITYTHLRNIREKNDQSLQYSSLSLEWKF